jgi:integrase
VARTINKLTAASVAEKSKTGRYGDGNGLWLQVSRWGTKAWLFRYKVAGKEHQMGLGSTSTFSLKEARERARAYRQILADGLDPIDARRDRVIATRAAKVNRVTFRDCAERYIASHKAGWKNGKHAEQWSATLTTYAYPVIGQLSVADVETDHILRILEPIWSKKTETASRVRGRVEAVLDWAKARDQRRGENPARWRGHLDKLLPAKTKVQRVTHQAAMPFDDVPAFVNKLRSLTSISARALEFTILTAARTGETIGAQWPEIDMKGKVWTVPPAHTKSGREHRVPLCDRALEILAALPREDGNDHVFVGARAGAGLSNMAMLELLRGLAPELTVHGFRSSFRDWAGEQTNYPSELAEAALAHRLKDKTEAAYRRGDALEKRRRLMTAWAAYCATPSVNLRKVVPIGGRA